MQSTAVDRYIEIAFSPSIRITYCCMDSRTDRGASEASLWWKQVQGTEDTSIRKLLMSLLALFQWIVKRETYIRTTHDAKQCDNLGTFNVCPFRRMQNYISSSNYSSCQEQASSAPTIVKTKQDREREAYLSSTSVGVHLILATVPYKCSTGLVREQVIITTGWPGAAVI